MSTLQLHREPNGVVTLTLNRPEVHNSFDDELITCLTETLAQLGKDPSARAIILTGQGTSFSAGADLHWMKSQLGASQQANEHDALHLARMLRTLNYLPQPTIARVNGPALGGGLGLVACCDLAVAADTALFGLTEARLGLAPAIISPYVFRRIGEAQSRRYFLSGERFDAAHARRIGLVHEFVPADALDETIDQLLAGLLKGGPRAVIEAKRLIFHAAGHSADVQLKLDQYTAQLIAGLRVSAEGQEGMRAFLEKRKPQWISEE